MKHWGHLDLNVAESCNFTCTSCSHAAPVNARYMMLPEELGRDLAAIKPFMHFNRLQMVGGEPTLHPNLPEMMRVARASGVGDEISVITNGSLLRRMPNDFWRELNTLQLSIYPRLDPDIPEFAKYKCEEFKRAFHFTVFTDFYQQIRKEPNDGQHFHSCHWRNDCWTLHRGYFYFCPQSLFFPKSILGHESIDGLPVGDLTEEKLDAFLTRKEPLETCKICMANEMRLASWKESKRSDWVVESTP